MNTWFLQVYIIFIIIYCINVFVHLLILICLQDTQMARDMTHIKLKNEFKDKSSQSCDGIKHTNTFSTSQHRDPWNINQLIQILIFF